MRGKKQNELSYRISRFFIKLFLAVVVLAVISGVVSRVFRLENITVVGTERYSDKEIEAIIKNKPTDNISFLFYLRYQLYQVPEIPFIEYTEVELTDKNSVTIYAYDKLVTGYVEVMRNYLYFDKDGIVVESSSKRLKDVPEITGLKFDKIELFEKLEIQKNNLFNTILNLTKLIILNELSVERVHFSSNYEVTLYCGGSIISLGRREFYDEQIGVLPSVLASANGRKLSIDLTRYDKENDKFVAEPIE